MFRRRLLSLGRRPKVKAIVGCVFLFLGIVLVLQYLLPRQDEFQVHQDESGSFQRTKLVIERIRNSLLQTHRQHQEKSHHNEPDLGEPLPQVPPPSLDKRPKNDSTYVIHKDPASALGGKASSPQTCQAIVSRDPWTTDIRMLDLYHDADFVDEDGGAWKQGWNVQADPSMFSASKKLKVFVIPHSHNDPGWIKTVEEYFETQTRHILDNAVDFLSANPEMRFIWAEMSYLSMWWDSATSSQREQMKQLVQGGRLELVTGGWVMPDEANSHVWSVVSQYVTGHEFIKENFGSSVRPRSGWSIDPFGYSSTLPYVLKGIGLNATLIQRAHYVVKRELARNKKLEFYWTQSWESQTASNVHAASATGPSSLLTHLMPFYSYDVPHTCGPDPAICCQFDFARMRGVSSLSCPWHRPPQQINARNIGERATLLLDQYRKKATLYGNNVLLIPLGDDFRYQTANEWSAQFENYQAIFDYWKRNPELNVEGRFSSLSEYFDALVESDKTFPSLSGDFFTYADIHESYWSGYFTSRPYFKRLDRVLIGYLRSAEILLSLTLTQMSKRGIVVSSTEDAAVPPWTKEVQALVRQGQQSLGLFQHHDGVTGTSKTYVMEDYGKKLASAVTGLQQVIQLCTSFLLSPSRFSDPASIPASPPFLVDDPRPSFHSLESHTRITVSTGSPAPIVLFNPLTFPRQEVLTIRIFTSNVLVRQMGASSGFIPSQISPVLNDDGTFLEGTYDLSFLAHVPALGFATYVVLTATTEQEGRAQFPKISVLSSLSNPRRGAMWPAGLPPDLPPEELGSSFSLGNSKFTVMFKDGSPVLYRSQSLKEEQPLNIEFSSYAGGKSHSDPSGAYLFIPSGPSKPFHRGLTDWSYVLMRGPLVSQFIKTSVSIRGFLQQTFTVYESPGLDGLSLEIENQVDVTGQRDFELAMDVVAKDIRHGETFFTSLNGFQMIRRERFSKLPIQANFYPSGIGAYIEDQHTRMTLLSGQALGLSSQSEGKLEVIQDRRHSSDDIRGMEQALMDNREIRNTFRVLFEDRKEPAKPNLPHGLLSRSAQLISESVLHPLIKQVAQTPDFMSEEVGLSKASMALVQQPLPCDYHLMSLRHMPKSFSRSQSDASATFLLHLQRFAVDCSVGYTPDGSCPVEKEAVTLAEVFGSGVFDGRMEEVSLTGNTGDFGGQLLTSDPITVQPMEIQGYLLTLGDEH